MKKIYDIKDIDCAHCALKIENELNDDKKIKLAQVNFMTQKVVIESDESIEASYLDKIAKSIEKEVTITTIQENNHEEESNKISIKHVLLLFGIALMVLTYYLNQTKVIELNIYTLLMVFSYVLIAYDIILRAIKNLWQGQMFDENVLMVIATVGALFLAEYIEAAAVMVFYQIGEYFQDMAVNRSRKSIQSLLDLKPKIVHLFIDNDIKDIHPDDIDIKNILFIKPGEMIPTDAVLIEGETSFDFSAITGESMPVESQLNLELPAGVINLDKPIKVEVTAKFKDSSLQKMIDFVESNSMKKAKAEKFITKFAKYYTPIVVGIAFMLAFLVPLILTWLTSDAYTSLVTTYIERSLIFLVISCPCALVLSIPLSFYAGIGLSSKNGILVKSGSDLEVLKDIEHFVFDKTGTLTKGQFSVVETINYQQEDTLFYAALLESISTHPIAQSIVKSYKGNISSYQLENAVEHFSKGVSAIYEHSEITVGNKSFFDELHIELKEIDSQALIIYVAKDREIIGHIKLEDELKPQSEKLITDLKKMNKKVSLVTGDHPKIAQYIGNKLGISDVYAGVKPTEKAEIVTKIKETEKVAFIGDGVNDAMVLISANLGISMGSLGSDVAIEASDIVIVNDDPYLIKKAIHVSKQTYINVIQNITLALGIKVIVLALGAFGLANMWMAIFADVGVSLLAVLNAMRLLYKK
ncbi:cadmium-translocating P-type ATPase [Mycoplasmatota bacterium]|nr:cadmium-translocating P-type ATPase [Mycoplasmatota bacterium]